MNIIELLQSTVERYPEIPALVFRDQEISYQELGKRVRKAASGLKALGVTLDTKVGLMMSNKPEYIITYFAILANGGTVVPLNPLFKEAEVAYILNDSDSEYLVLEEMSLSVIQRVKNELTSVKDIICYGDSDEHSWASLLTYPEMENFVPRYGSETAQIIYTSGTTGFPKGAMITHANLNWMAIAAAVTNSVKPGDRILCVLPLFHAYAKLQGALANIAHGGTIYIEERFEPVSILDKLAKNKINIFLGVPTMYTMFIHSPNINELDFSALRIAGSGGASIPAEVIDKVKQLMDVDISEGYGLTESTVMLCASPREGVKKVGSTGVPLAGVSLKIVDPEGNKVGPKEVGEIIFRGPNLMKGYYKQPQETANAIRDGWMHTGDLAYADEDGYIFIVDRMKDMIIRGGFNVYPREVEEVLYTHPNVIECAIIGRPDPVFGEKIAAYVVTKTEQEEEELREYCKQKLVHYKTPDYIIFIKEIPKSGTGKMLKTALKKLDKETINP